MIFQGFRSLEIIHSLNMKVVSAMLDDDKLPCAYGHCKVYPIQYAHGIDLHYRQFSDIRRTQSQNINVSRLVLQLSLPNPLKPGVKLRMKM